ncbi:hypothetical protein SUS17_590 [Sphingomonas sp. S17]|jgi:hypothetical protein|nr:hypothetical protein SUS17_590 [Sphingomonas sp. S17]
MMATRSRFYRFGRGRHHDPMAAVTARRRLHQNGEIEEWPRPGLRIAITT